jgi:hypothetical protein
MKVYLGLLILTISLSAFAQEQVIQERTFKKHSDSGRLVEALNGYECEANTYISKTSPEMRSVGRISLDGSFSKAGLVSGIMGSVTHWNMSRTQDMTDFNVVSPNDATLIMSVPDIKKNDYLAEKENLKNAKLTVEGGLRKYELKLKAGTPFKLNVRNVGAVGFEIPEEKTIMTCNLPLETKLNADPQVYGETMTIMSVNRDFFSTKGMNAELISILHDILSRDSLNHFLSANARSELFGDYKRLKAEQNGKEHPNKYIEQLKSSDKTRSAP